MEKSEVEKRTTAEDGSQLNRNRSFKSKQLVRSQAIRESTSPPRTISPSVQSDDSNHNARVNVSNNANVRVNAGQAIDSSHDSDVFSCSDRKCAHNGKQRVEIQITSGGWESEPGWSMRGRSRRWCDSRESRDSRDAPRDLLSNNPRVACVCGACSACPHCRGRRRRHNCPTKQDSGIVCSEDCPDCSDTEQNGTTNELKKSASGSLDSDDQYYCRCADRKEKPKSISLSRTDSEEKSEPNGPELVAFIKETLNKNARDRTTLLKIERELHCFVNDNGRCIVKFPVMTSYGRMLVHRCASLFQLAHHLDQSNKTCVIVSKNGTSGGRIPCTSFKTWCVANLPPSPLRHQPDPTHAKSILKRDTHSLDEPSLGANAMSRSKSLEQREREYQQVRRRIFSSDNCNQDESQWPWINAGAPVKLLAPEPGRNKLLKVQSLENPSGPPPSGHSWRNAAGAVSKSHSFGGYGDQAQPRALSRQGDLASSSWRLSPSSSGYKTLSLRSTDSVTPSPTGGGTPEPAPTLTSNRKEPAAGKTSVSGEIGSGGGGGALVWAVTDLAAVPVGALVIHPQTGRPLTNPDGSVYHFDPANPPVLYDPNVYVDSEVNHIDQNNEKRRGRLEKQHSFMDNESECQTSDECRSKCYCECQKQDQQLTSQTPLGVSETVIEKESPKPPPSPIKTIDNMIADVEPTNSKPPSDASINQKSPDIQRSESTNQRYENQIQTNRAFELANQREAVKMMSQDMVHYNQGYTQYNTEEISHVTSPAHVNPYHQEASGMQPVAVSHAKLTPVPVQDPNIRPMSLTNFMYPTAMPQGYPTYIPNHRMDQLQQQMYQPMLQQQMEEPKQISTSPQAHDNTFRIDPSYPYAPVDYTNAACGACVDTAQLHHPQHQRSYSVPYNQVEVPSMPTLMPPTYQVPNILLPPPMPQYQVQYQEPVQWTQMQNAVGPKLFEMTCPVVYPHHYTHYNVLYPQVVTQPYPVCQPVYPALENKAEQTQGYQSRKRNSLTHTPAPNEHTDKQLNRQNSTEIALKVQQITEQMNQISTRGGAGRGEPRREGEWRRNSGHGILGSCPTNTYSGHYNHGRSNDETQLSTAARAIINSLRNMQAKNTYHQQEKRTYETQTYNRSFERQDRNDNNSYRRNRYDRDNDKPSDRTQGNTSERQEVNTKGDGDRKFEPRNRVNPVNLPYRPPYVFRQMSPGTWCRRSPAPVHPAFNPRRPHPDTRPRR